VKLLRLCVTLIIVWPYAAAAADPAAVVAKYLPPKAEHVIVRADGDEKIAGLGTPLYAGDIVRVTNGGSLDIAYSDGDGESLEGPTTFTVPEKEPMGMAAKIYDRLQVIMGRKYRQGSNLATRNPGNCDAETLPMSAPVLSATTYLLAGHENVALAWVGGCAPYSLRIAGTAGVVAELDGLKRPLTRVDTQNLAVGKYTLMLSDARSQQLAVALEITAEVPAGPAEFDNIETELDAVAYAAWLANHDNSTWRLESFQQLRPWIRGGGVMAGTYGDLVMWGNPGLDADVAE